MTSSLKAHLAPLLHIPLGACITLTVGILSTKIYGLTYTPTSLFLTAGLIIPAFLLSSRAFRSLSWSVAAATTTYAFFLLGNAAKTAHLHTPLSISDINALPVLLNTLPLEQFSLAIGLFLIAGAMAFISIRWCRASILPLVMSAAYLATLPWLAHITAELVSPRNSSEEPRREMPNGEVVEGNGVGSKIEYLQTAGPLAYLAMDWRLLKADTGIIPSRSEILELSIPNTTDGLPESKRNVHIVLLESIWDTSLLDDSISSESLPWDARFLDAWRLSGKPYTLSPAMGGSTANAEFETLCGFHAPQNSVAFVNLLRRPSPCIPARLANDGYHTITSHAHLADNWNRILAYRYVGFDTYNPIEAFDLDDMDGPFLTDQSFFTQNLAYLKTLPKDRPVLNYLVTLSSHWAYPRNLNRRPDIVTNRSDNTPVLRNYMNSSAYTTKAFMDWVDGILQLDPNALIVAFGDHAPVLDENPDPYDKLNPTGNYDTLQTKKLVGLSRTPLLIIDGTNGPVPMTGDIPMYEIPRLIGQQLKSPLLLPQLNHLRDIRMRPFLGTLLVDSESGWHSCQKDDPSTNCIAAFEQFKTMRSLRQDVIYGGAHFLLNSTSSATRNPLAHSLKITERLNSCEFDIGQLGPTTGELNKGFNIQPDGTSALWITMKSYRGTPEVRIGETIGSSTYGEGVITSAFANPELFSKPGHLPVSLHCKNDPPVMAGHISIPPSSGEDICSFSIDFWGPTEGKIGHGFNLQPDGSSSIWINFKHLEGEPKVFFDDQPGIDTTNGKVITSIIDAAKIMKTPGKLPIYLQCTNQARELIGEMNVIAP